MLTEKEAKARIKRWGSHYNQEVFERPNGFRFVKTTLVHVGYVKNMKGSMEREQVDMDVFTHVPTNRTLPKKRTYGKQQHD